MSWLSGYKSKTSTSADSREEKREKLEAERQQRLQKRAALKQQLQQAQQYQDEANQAIKDLLELDPDIFNEPSSLIDSMVDFDQENAEDSATAMDNLRTVLCPFNKEDIEFWFSQLEDQLTLIGVKRQWTKKIALVRFLPPDIQISVKSLLKLSQTAAGTDIYFRIKKQLLKLYGPKPEDAYIRAKNRVLTDKPSQLGKLILEDICTGDIKLQGCHCDKIVWGMFREKIPIIVRNHIADMPFNKDTYETVFDKADQVWDSNRGAEPVVPTTAAVAVETSEVAAVKSQYKNNKNKNQQNNKNQNNKNGQNQNQGGQNGQNKNQNGQNTPKPKVNEDNLCRIHAKWKENATFCAAPWGCRMKNVYKAPQ